MGKVFKGFCYGLAFCTVAECMGSYDASRAKKRINKNLTENYSKSTSKISKYNKKRYLFILERRRRLFAKKSKNHK